MKQEEEVRDLLTRARNQFNQAYPSYGLTGVEHENVSYDRILSQCRTGWRRNSYLWSRSIAAVFGSVKETEF